MITRDLYGVHIYDNFKTFPLERFMLQDKVWKCLLKLQIPAELSV